MLTNVRGRSGRGVSILLALSLLLANCVDTTSMSPAQRQIEQSQQRFVATTAEGVVAGALLGALVGGLTGGGRGALIGAGAGGLAGGVAGYLVAQNNFQHAHTEANLQAATTDATEQANAARKDAVDAQQIAAEARAQANRLSAQYRAGSITLDQYKAGLASYQRSITTLQALSKGAAEQATTFRASAAAATGAGARSLNASANQVDNARMAIDRAAESLRITLASQPA